MKKNDLSSAQEFEKILKEKMNELSSSVDCFDKISARAFPEKDPDFSEGGFTVSDLENVTGKRRILPVFRWVSAAAAIVLLIGIIPKTALINSLREPSDKSAGTRTYNDLLSEISDETSSGNYYICDLALDDYISRDVLVTPLYSCPFSESNEDVKVRLFIRTIGGIRTNQIYAVKYSGEYSEENIIAAAETGVSFSKKEEKALAKNTDYNVESMNVATAAASAAFRCNTDSGKLTDSAGNEVSAASFTGFSIYKDGKDADTVRTDIVYYRHNDSNDYFYDIRTTDGGGEELEIDRNSWKTAVSYNGITEQPAENTDVMTKTELFTGSYEKVNDIWYYNPVCVYPWTDGTAILPADEYIAEVHNSYNTTGEILSQIAVPEDTAFQRSLNIYLGKKSPIAVYPESSEGNAQYYSTISLGNASDDISADISQMIDELEDELNSFKLSVNNPSMTETDKQNMAIREQELQTEIDILQEYQQTLYLAKAEEIRNANGEAEKTRKELENFMKNQEAEQQKNKNNTP